MLPEVGASELIVLAAVALIVVGPKDLPILLRRLGQFMGRMRGLAADFRASFDDMARQSELEDLRKEVNALRETKLVDTLGPVPTFEEINQGLQPTHSTPSSPHDPELVADQEAIADGAEPSILPPEPVPASEPEPEPVVEPTTAEAMETSPPSAEKRV
jgi:sec-independent protein translocase protein TatB